MLISYLTNKKIPKLVDDGVWKQNASVGIDYFLRVKRDNGEGEAEGVKGFVGIKDKSELTPSSWIYSRDKETDISIYDYLSLFKILEHKGYKIITFNIREDSLHPPSAPPDDNNLYENNRFTQFKDDNLIVTIQARRGRIKMKKRQFVKKIEDIVKEATQIPM